MTSLGNELIVSKLERAIEDLSERDQAEGAEQRRKMIDFFRSVIAESRDEAEAYDARMLARLSLR